MAIDTLEKLRSSANVSLPFMAPGVTPVAVEDAEWLMQAGWMSSVFVVAGAGGSMTVASRFRSRVSVIITTDSSGGVNVDSPTIKGRLVSIEYQKDDFANGVDIFIRTADGRLDLWVEGNVNASKKVAPRQPTHDLVGGAALYAAAGEAVEDNVYMAEEAANIVIASGGSKTSGTFVFTYE